MTRNKVVLVPFPFDDLSASKVRAAVCLTDPVGPHRHVILAFVTSQVSPAPLETDIVLESGDPAFPATGLRVSSMIQLHRLMTVSSSITQRELGEIPPDIQKTVAGKLRKLLGL